MPKTLTKKIQYIQRNPTTAEVVQLQLAMSSFCDGSGQEKDTEGKTRPGWRDFERIFAELLQGKANENKDIFDVLVPSLENVNTFYGVSLKSKELSRPAAIADLEQDGRVHMEIANSPAKFWAALREKNISESDFRNQKKANDIGDVLIRTIHSWHEDAVKKFQEINSDKNIDLAGSIYLTISYSKKRVGIPRKYQVHSFGMNFPRNIIWKYISERCLRGYDPDRKDDTLVDWYGLSGGQFKYYPAASKSRFRSTSFELLEPKNMSIVEKAKTYWPDKWLD